MFIILFIYTKRDKKELEKDVSNILFETFTVCKHEACQALKSNSDGYISRLDSVNLTARGCNNLQDYYNQIDNCVLDSKINQGALLNPYLFKIDNLKHIHKYINTKKFHDIPWNIILTKGKYEGSMPHTRYVNNTPYIILPLNYINTRNLERTLLHEKIHLYQKIFKEDFDKKINGEYQKLDLVDSMLRQNPDTDGCIYLNKTNNKLMMCKFLTKTPSNLNDVIYGTMENNPRYEHPYEFYAYKISEEII